MKSLICTTLLVETSPQGLPLGAACIASALKADARTKNAVSVSLIDFSLEDDEIISAKKSGGDDAIAQFLANQLASKKPDFIAFSVYVWNRLILEKTCTTLKKMLPNSICIAGGPEVTADPLSFHSFDFMISGQGERAMVELVDSLAKGKKIDIQGVYTASAQSGAQTNEIARACPLPPDMTASPYLDGTLDPSKYGGALWELARGCPFKCSYCYESKGEKKIAYFPMERLEKEIELFARKKIAQIFVLDPTYNASKERALKMLKTIEKKAPGMFFYFEARAEFIDRELAYAFSRVPCCLQIGLQSANPEVLKNVHRTLDKKKFIKNIGFLNEAGVTFGFDLIYGLPGDTFAGFCESIDFALSLYPNNLELFCLSVLPGTDLHDDAASFGLHWEKIPPYHVLKTPTFNEADLARAKKLAEATNLFYTKGRAVAWFNSVLYVLKETPSVFLKQFSDQESVRKFLNSHEHFSAEHTSDKKIEEIQLDFVKKRFTEKHMDKYFAATEDLIKMHSALGRCTFDGTESKFSTHYHPADIMSEYGTDIVFFTEHCGKQKCTVQVFVGKNGVDWRTM